ncbi:hypothetical protein [Pectobacterium brasiliense]|uniref:hypothetical protein n=1 Tax=Pectobacterium brasiliense TaxID=180957 RepID=UPI0025A1AD8E|nr:hypothetical protein [Pectobacterium brasiliense]WJM80442.1 hypothetical protein QTI90_19540 [Pectobacterium brasiliense]
MSEEIEKQEEQEEQGITHTYADPVPDYILQDFVSWANLGLRISLTISIKGNIYSGMLISGAQWCEKNIDDIENTNASDELKNTIKAYYNNLKEERYSSPEKANSGNIGFLHIDNVRIISGNRPSEFETRWRFKIGEIDGFSLGKIEPSQQ